MRIFESDLPEASASPAQNPLQPLTLPDQSGFRFNSIASKGARAKSRLLTLPGATCGVQGVIPHPSLCLAIVQTSRCRYDEAMQQAITQGIVLSLIGTLLIIEMVIFVFKHPRWTSEPLDAQRKAVIVLFFMGLFCELAAGATVVTANY